jgi:hypothetical protein
MSAGLISKSNPLHSFEDDLESSIYVLLWLTLMYSEVTNSDVMPPFLSSVLDPQPYSNNGGYAKTEFLMGRAFLAGVQFPGRPALHKLISDLAQLFSVRYEPPPSDADRQAVHALLQSQDPGVRAAYDQTITSRYDKRKSQLEGHDATITFFDEALNDCSNWPQNDRAVRQNYSHNVQPRKVIKTGWHTGLHVENN